MRFKSRLRRGRDTLEKTAHASSSVDQPVEPLPRGERGRFSWLVCRPNRPGKRFLLLLLVMGFAAHNTRNNLLYLMFSMGFATVVVSPVIGWLSLKRLALEKGRAEDLYAGAVSVERFHLRNTSRWVEVYGVEVEDLDFPGPSPKAYLSHLGRGQGVSFVIEVTYPRRGIYDCHRMRLSTEFPFGLFRIARTVHLTRRVTVFPYIHRVNMSFVFRQRSGQVPERHSLGESEELRRIRSYTVGDGFHHIHWKASAKLGELMVREFASSQQRSFTVILDNHAVASDDRRAGSGSFEPLVSLAASVVSHLSSHRIPYRLVSQDEAFHYGFGVEHLRGVLTYLAVSEPRSEPEVDIRESAAESLTRGDVVLVVSAASKERWASVASPGLHFIDREVGTSSGTVGHAG